MTGKEKNQSLSAHQYTVLTELVGQGENIYKIERKRAQMLIAKGLLIKRDRGPYALTPLAHELLTTYVAPTERPKRVHATDRVIEFVNSLALPKTSRGDVVAHLEIDGARGTDTSRRFMRPKGRRQPRNKGSA